MSGSWLRRRLAMVPGGLSAIAVHPFLSVVYGTERETEGTVLHSWRLDGARALPLAAVRSRGRGACHVAVDETGSAVAVSDYRSGSISVHEIAADGSPTGRHHVHDLVGHGIDPERQTSPHPHHALFVGRRLHVADLGVDLVRVFDVAPGSAPDKMLMVVGELPVPPGTGVRDLVFAGNRLAASGELASTVLFAADGGGWVVRASTAWTGDARNHPGSVAVSGGRAIHVANRGADTIATFSVSGPEASARVEVPAGVGSPLHLLVDDGCLYVIGRGSAVAVEFELEDDVPRRPSRAFRCPGAVWLAPDPMRRDDHGRI